MAKAHTKIPFILTLLLAGACSDKPALSGQVTDIWGKALPGATVQLAGVVEHITTNDAGQYAFVDAPLGELEIQAGKDGYIRAHTKLTKKLVGGDTPKADLQLYPEPRHPGFYAVDRREYGHLGAMTVKTKGTELRAYTGLPEAGEIQLRSKEPLSFVFKSTVKSSQLARLDLQLHALEFVEKVSVPGLMGAAPSTVNLWVATESQPFELRGLPGDHYLITTDAALPAGHYAFHTQGVLASDEIGALDKLPKEMQVAYPFEVR